MLTSSRLSPFGGIFKVGYKALVSGSDAISWFTRFNPMILIESGNVLEESCSVLVWNSSVDNFIISVSQQELSEIEASWCSTSLQQTSWLSIVWYIWKELYLSPQKCIATTGWIAVINIKMSENIAVVLFIFLINYYKNIYFLFQIKTQTHQS